MFKLLIFISIFSIGNLFASAKTEKTSKVLQYDRAMTHTVAKEKNIQYHSPFKAPFRLSGFAYGLQDGLLSRFPSDPALPKSVQFLATHCAGGRIDFKTDSRKILIKVELRNSSHMYHMPDTGSCGCDVYMGEPGKEFFVGVTKFRTGSDSYTCQVPQKAFETKKIRNFTINLPLYSGIKSIEIGLEKGAKILEPAPWSSDSPIVVYGSSITQGGCASRPGMAYPAIISRKLNRPVLNFGFSGNGKGEAIVAEYLAKIADPALYLLDYEPNAHPAGIRQTLSTFLDILRTKHPETPIIQMSRLRFIYDVPVTESTVTKTDSMIESIKFQQNEILRRQNAGDKNIYFLSGAELCGENWHEYSVDGTHQTDLGFSVIAKGLIEKMKAWDLIK